MSSRRFKSYLMLIAVAAIWGAAGPIIKYTLGGIDPLPFLAYRFTIASVFSAVFFLIKIRSGKKFRQLKANFSVAFLYGFLAVPLALGILFFGLDKSTVLELSLIGVVGPLLVTAGGALFFRDRITKKEKTGILIVLAGVLFNTFYPIFQTGSEVLLTGNVLLLIYLLADAAAILIAKKAVRRKIKSANLTNLSFIIGAVVLIPLTLILNGTQNTINTIISLPFRYHLGVWYMALISGNLAYYLYVRGQRSIEVSEATLFNYLQPLFMVPLAVFWLGEPISAPFIIGAAIIALGLIVAEYKKGKKLKKVITSDSDTMA